MSGSVKEIRIFSTELASPDNIRIVIPNSAVFGGVIKNFSGYETRRIDLTIGIGYSTSIDRAMDVVREVLNAEGRVFSEPEAQIVVTELADSSVNLLVRCLAGFFVLGSWPRLLGQSHEVQSSGNLRYKRWTLHTLARIN